MRQGSLQAGAYPSFRVVFLGKTLHSDVLMGTGDRVLCWVSPCDGLAFHPGGSRNIPSQFMLQNQTGILNFQFIRCTFYEN